MDTLTQTPEPRVTTRSARPLAVLGGLATAVAAVLPWVTVQARLPVDPGLLGADVSAGRTTVNGLDTVAWPALLAVGLLATVLAVAGRARRLLLTLGVLGVAAGAGLYYYLANAVDIKTADRSVLERAVADLAVHTSVGPGPYVLLGAGACIVLGALRPRR